MSNVQKSEQTISLADFTQDLYLDLVLPYEKESVVNGNLITVIVDKIDFKMTLAVGYDDTVKSLTERFNALLEEETDMIESFEKWSNDNYEHASVTQGYAFDSLTC